MAVALNPAIIAMSFSAEYFGVGAAIMGKPNLGMRTADEPFEFGRRVPLSPEQRQQQEFDSFTGQLIEYLHNSVLPRGQPRWTAAELDRGYEGVLLKMLAHNALLAEFERTRLEQNAPYTNVSAAYFSERGVRTLFAQFGRALPARLEPLLRSLNEYAPPSHKPLSAAGTRAQDAATSIPSMGGSAPPPLPGPYLGQPRAAPDLSLSGFETVAPEASQHVFPAATERTAGSAPFGSASSWRPPINLMQSADADAPGPAAAADARQVRNLPLPDIVMPDAGSIALTYERGLLQLLGTVLVADNATPVPVPMVIDTGALRSAMDADFFRTLGLPKLPIKQTVTLGTGASASVESAVIPKIEIAPGFVVRNLPVWLAPGLASQGKAVLLLGADVLHDVAVGPQALSFGPLTGNFESYYYDQQGLSRAGQLPQVIVHAVGPNGAVNYFATLDTAATVLGIQPAFAKKIGLQTQPRPFRESNRAAAAQYGRLDGFGLSQSAAPSALSDQGVYVLGESLLSLPQMLQLGLTKVPIAQARLSEEDKERLGPGADAPIQSVQGRSYSVAGVLFSDARFWMPGLAGLAKLAGPGLK